MATSPDLRTPSHRSATCVYVNWNLIAHNLFSVKIVILKRTKKMSCELRQYDANDLENAYVIFVLYILF